MSGGASSRPTLSSAASSNQIKSGIPKASKGEIQGKKGSLLGIREANTVDERLR